MTVAQQEIEKLPPRNLTGLLEAGERDEVMASDDFMVWAGTELESGEVITDEEGKPAVFYHGGADGIEEFSRQNPLHTGEGQEGLYFTPRIQTANYYASTLAATQSERGEAGGASVYAVFLKIKNPMVVQQGDTFTGASIDVLPEGHDGVVNPQSQEVVVFDPSQVFVAKRTER